MMQNRLFVRWLAPSLCFAGGGLLSFSSLAERSIYELSLKELMKVPVVSSNKFERSRDEVAAAVYVITARDIANAGATQISQVLSMVPGLFVRQASSNNWALGSRGFGSVFSNKMLVMIDGRSLYSPLFSGTFWDQLDMLVSDIERVEVIRGPGSTVWGANAVNGVINVITKSPKDYPGQFFYAAAGDQLRYDSGYSISGPIDKWGSARFYAKRKSVRSSDYYPATSAVIDSWNSTMAGLKLDKPLDNGEISITTDWLQQSLNEPVLSTSLIQAPQAHLDNTSHQVNLQWLHRLTPSHDWTMAAQHQRSRRDSKQYLIDDSMVNFEFDGRYQFQTHQLSYGLGWRRHIIDFDPRIAFYTLSGQPIQTHSRIHSAFLQHEWTFIRGHRLIIGSKFEAHRQNHQGTDATYRDDMALPNIRYSMDLSEDSQLWAALSRSARVPSMAEQVIRAPLFYLEAQSPSNPLPWPVEYQTGGRPGFQEERVDTIELGGRFNLSFDQNIEIALYHSDYQDLRIINLQDPQCQQTGLNVPFCAANDVVVIPNRFESLGGLRLEGMELNWQYRLKNTMQFSLAYSYTHQTLDEIHPLLGLFEFSIHLTPRHQLGLQLDWQIDDKWNLQMKHLYVGGTQNDRRVRQTINPRFLTHYHTMDVVLSYQLSKPLRLTLNLDNLWQDSGNEWITEFASGSVSETERQLRLGLEYKF